MCEFASLMREPEGCVGLAQAHSSQSRADLCPAQVLSTVSSFGSSHFSVWDSRLWWTNRNISFFWCGSDHSCICWDSKIWHMLFNNGFFNWAFFAQSPGSFAKVKDSANSLLKAADYSSSSDEASSSSSSDEDDTNHTRLAWLLFLIIIIFNNNDILFQISGKSCHA